MSDKANRNGAKLATWVFVNFYVWLAVQVLSPARYLAEFFDELLNVTFKHRWYYCESFSRLQYFELDSPLKAFLATK